MTPLTGQYPFKFFTEPAAQASLFFIGGMTLNILNCSLAYPILTIFGSMTIAGLAIKLLNRYDLGTITQIKMNVLQLEKKYPKIRIIAFIFTITISAVSGIIGCFAGGLFGIYSGIIAATEYSRKLQNASLEKTELQRNQIILS